MPHAALCVVQQRRERMNANLINGFNAARGFVGGATLYEMVHNPEYCQFQCRTRLCGWCSQRSPHQGGRIRDVSMPHAAIPFRPHHRFAVPLPRSRRGGLVTLCFFAESRNISFPLRCGGAVNVCQSHFVLLVFLGRFPIRPVSRSAVPYGLASRTGQ